MSDSFYRSSDESYDFSREKRNKELSRAESNLEKADKEREEQQWKKEERLWLTGWLAIISIGLVSMTICWAMTPTAAQVQEVKRIAIVEAQREEEGIQEAKRIAAEKAQREEERERRRAKIESKIDELKTFVELNQCSYYSRVLAEYEVQDFQLDNDFNLERAKKTCLRNKSFQVQGYSINSITNQLRVDNNDAALTAFQRCYGVSDENAEAACKEWILKNGSVNWLPFPVMAICLRNKESGIPEEYGKGKQMELAGEIIGRAMNSYQPSGRSPREILEHLNQSSQSEYESNEEKLRRAYDAEGIEYDSQKIKDDAREIEQLVQLHLKSGN